MPIVYQREGLSVAVERDDSSADVVTVLVMDGGVAMTIDEWGEVVDRVSDQHIEFGRARADGV